MKTVKKVGELEIINWAGCFIIHKGNERVGGIYATEDETFHEVIDMERKRLGIKVRERGNA